MLAVVKVVGSSAVLVAIGAVVYMLGRRRARVAASVILICGLLAASSAFAASQPGSPKPRSAEGGTMRVDYYHTGNAKEERFSMDRVVLEPLPWPGNPARPIDDTNRGKYFFEVVDAASGAVRIRAASARSTASGRRPAKRKT